MFITLKIMITHSLTYANSVVGTAVVIRHTSDVTEALCACVEAKTRVSGLVTKAAIFLGTCHIETCQWKIW